MSFVKVAQSCINILFPEQCVACGSFPAAYPLPICPKCSDSIIRSTAPLPGSSKNLTKILSCRYYEGALKECVKQFKYFRKLKLIDLFQPVIHTFLTETDLFPERVHGAIPVPVHPSKRRSRGYNQSDFIATILSHEISTPVHRYTLIKTRNTAPQTALAKNERIRNLDGSFAVVDRTLVTGKNLVLVDDTVTTGATLETCACELLKAGACSVSAFTLAKTP